MNKKKPHSKYKNILYFILSISIWIIVWELLALRMNKPIFLPTPRSALITLFRLGRTMSFWETIFATFYKISLGFLYAALVGVSLAILSAFCKPVKFLFSPILRLIKAIPVASFIILALLWMDSNNLSILISFMMVLPVIYINVLHGFELVDPRLLEMAQVFDMSNMRKI